MSARVPVPAVAALGAAALLGLYLSVSFVLSGHADVRRHSSSILDMDVSRVVADVASPRPAYRASVHPLQKLLLAPLGIFLNRALFAGRDALAAVQLMVALFMLAQALACGWLTRQLTRGAGAPALAAALVCGVSFSSILAASIPESAAFASLAGILPLLLLGARWERPFGWGEACAWSALAVIGVGLTLTQVAFWAIAFGVRLWRSGEGGVRIAPATFAVALAVAAFAGATLLQSLLYPGTTELWAADPFASERPWLRTDALLQTPLAHGLRVLAHFLVLDFAAPFPVYSDFLLRAGFDYWSLSIEEATLADVAPAQLALAGVVLAAVVAAARLSLRRDPRFLAPALCIASQLGLHLVYGREYVLYSPHWHGVLVALLVAGAWNGLGERRRWVPGVAAGLAALLLANNLLVMRAVYREVTFGLGAEHRDARGRLRGRGLSPTPPRGPAPPRSSRPPGASGGTP